MGSYLSTSELTNHVGSTRAARLTNETAGGAAVTARLTEAIDRAEGRINSALATRDWSTPINLTAYPNAAGVLAWATKGFAVYELHGRAEVTPDSVVRDEESVQTWLDKISAGEADLPVDTEITETQASTGMTLVSHARASGRDNMGGL